MDTAANITQVALSLALVLGALGALTWVTNRLRSSTGARTAGDLRIISATSIGPKEKLMIVDVAGEQLLLGVSASGVNKLHQLSEPIQVAAHEHPAPANMFSKLLAHHRESQQ